MQQTTDTPTKQAAIITPSAVSPPMSAAFFAERFPDVVEVPVSVEAVPELVEFPETCVYLIYNCQPIGSRSEYFKTD